MEAAAERVKLLTRSILPERPHQLSKSPDWKTRYPLDDTKRRCEEWQDTRLQYMTLVSEADRGILFTRGYYDIRPEPVQPAPKDVSIVSRAGGEKKKLTLNDYKNKKSGAPPSASASPPDSAASAALKKELERSTANTTPLDARAPGTKSPQESRKPEGNRQSQLDAVGSSRPKAAPSEKPVDMRLPLKPPPSLPPKPPTPESRKRVADNDDVSRPLKRPKAADAGRPSDPKSQSSRDEVPRRKPHESSSTRESGPGRDSSTGSSALPNGRSLLKAAMAPGRHSSPPPRERGSSINGVRPSNLENSRSTSGKALDTSKSSVPPLLSPLHLDIDKEREDAARKAEKRRREDWDVGKPSKGKATDGQQSSKPRKSSVRLPALLSPTLPPEVEAELRREANKKASPKSSEDVSRDERDAYSTSKKARTDEYDDAPVVKNRKTMIVTIKIPKRARQTVKRILALSTASRKEPPRTDRPSTGSGAASTPPATKRPVASAEASDTIAVKRPRAPDLPSSSRPPVPPSTPSKKAAQPMSRVSSNNSLAHTPGDTITATPTVPGSSDRLTNGPEPLSKADKARIQVLREKELALCALGKRLKHNGDVAMKGQARGEPNAATNGSTRPGESSTKLAYVLMLESTISFMMGFHTQDVYRGMQSKPSDPNSWTSLFPLLDFLQKDMRRFDARRYRPIYALSLLLQGVSYDELLKSYSTHENASSITTVNDLLKYQRGRGKAWAQLHEANKSIDSDLRAAIHPWTTVEEAAGTVLRVLRHWCDEEHLEWKAELNLREFGPKGIAQG